MAADELIGRKARAFFEDLWQRGDDWEIESSEYEMATPKGAIQALAREH